MEATTIEETNTQPTKELSETELLDKAWDFYNEAAYEDALKEVESAITFFGETKDNLQAKMYIMFAKENYNEAVQATIKYDDITGNKSAWNSIYIAEAYLNLEQLNEAVKWVEEAIYNREFTSISYFEEEEVFNTIKETEKYSEYVSYVKDSIGIDKIAKNFTVKTLVDNNFQLADQKGKVILIDFWATWCGPCVREMPSIIKYYNEFKDSGFDIIGISLDADFDKLQNYINENNIEWNIAFSGEDWNDPTAAMYKVKAIPSTFLIDKNGILRYVDLRGEDLRKAIMELIEE